MKNPTISVIIPTYNRAHLIGRAIQSVLNQTYQNFELIVVDDGSTDNTEDIIRQFQEKDKRIKYIKHDKNKGGSAARNSGIKMSFGDYIAFLDSDDEWLPGKLEKQLKTFKNSSLRVGAIYSGFQYIYQEGIDVDKRHTPKNRGYIYEDLLMGNCVGSASTLLIKKECFNRVKLFDESLPCCQDWDMWVRIAKYYEFDYIKDPLVKYQVHDNQISTNLNAVITGEKIIIDKYLKEFLKNPIVYSKHCFFLGNKLCHVAEMREGRKYLLKAIRIYPVCVKYYVYFFSSLFGVQFYKFCYKIKKIILNFLEKILIKDKIN